MLNTSAELSVEWEGYKAANPGYVNDTAGVVDWFFRRSAYYDTEAFVYPVGILYTEPTETLPLATIDEDSSTSPEDGGGSLEQKSANDETSSGHSSFRLFLSGAIVIGLISGFAEGLM